jgi:DNA polymerase-1
VLRIINGGVDASPLITPDRLMLLLGVRPEQYRDFAALRGDPSDNLPGVRGVGSRTAARLLAEFGSAADAFADLGAVRDRLGAGVATRLSADGARAAWELNCRVMAMHHDVPLGTDLVAGPGVLPVAAESVDTVFDTHRLVWTAGRAAHLLAGAPESVPRERPPEPWIERPAVQHRERRTVVARTAALVPAVDQLSLF